MTTKTKIEENDKINKKRKRKRIKKVYRIEKQKWENRKIR